ncbi:MAG: hypothetical protein ABSB57_02660 [Dehalococcoidia bacterium]
MSESIRPADLLIDEQNPRILQPNLGQHGAIQALAQLQGRKLLALTKDIVKYGLNPSELSIVMPHEGDFERYVVLEGNRRLAALRALENPELLVDAVEAKVLKEIRRLSHAYQGNPVESVECLVVGNRPEAGHWIELRHTGERGGAGIVPWGSDESTRYSARSGKVKIHQQALDFLERRGDLSPQGRRAVPTTSFKRLIQTPEVRSKLGLEVQAGRLCLLADENNVAKALLHVTGDLASGKIRVKDIYHRGQRIAYANALPSSIVVRPTMKSGQGVDIETGETEVKPKRPPSVRVVPERDKLIPHDCVLEVSDPRCRQIGKELRRLSLKDYPNAVSVLLRVFIELGADAYIEMENLPTASRSSLRSKLRAVMDALILQQKLTKQQAQAVRRVLQRDSFLAPSIDLMHSYIHNQYVFPTPSDLRAEWDNLQPFVIAMWAC